MKKTGIVLMIFAIALITIGIVIGYQNNLNNENEENNTSVIGNSNEEEENFQFLSFSVYNAETPLSIYTKNYKDFEGLKDTVSGSTITKTKEKGIIKSVSSASDFGRMYHGSYDIEGENVKNATYIVEGISNEYDPVEIGMNYYSSGLSVELIEADSIEYNYEKSILVNDIATDCIVRFSNYDKALDLWRIGFNSIEFKFSITKETDIEIAWNEDHFDILSEEDIDNLSIIITDHYEIEPIASYEVTNKKNNYKVAIENNNIIVE